MIEMWLFLGCTDSGMFEGTISELHEGLQGCSENAYDVWKKMHNYHAQFCGQHNASSTVWCDFFSVLNFL